MAEQGTLYFGGGDPARILRAFRLQGLSIEVTGPTRSWRQVVITAREAMLTLRLTTQRNDPAYFRRQIPLLLADIRQAPSTDKTRVGEMIRLVESVHGSIGLTAEPSFDANDDLITAIKLAAQSVDGFFSMADGFLDAEGKPLLLSDGTSDPTAQLPVLPPVEVDPWSMPDESTAPSPRRVAERAFVMLAVAYRALIDRTPTHRDAASRLSRLGTWFWELDIANELEPHERQVLDAELGSIPPDVVEAHIHSFEAILVLAWALRLVKLPPHDRAVDPKRLANVLGLFSEDARFVIDSADVRSPHELREAADRILAVHWRLSRFDENSAALDMAGMAAEAWFGEADSGKLGLIDNDLALVGKPVTDSSADVRQRCRDITLQRHRAINWLLGHHPEFSKVETST